MKVSLIIPTLNEIEGMRQIMPRINREWVDEIIVIDGNSTDGTFEYAQEQGYIALRQKSRGSINAYPEAFRAATGDVILTFSPDGNSVPERIPELVSKMREGYDMVIVSRYCEGARSLDDDFMSALGNRLFTNTINLLFGTRYTDSLVMFRAWRRELLTLVRNDVSQAGFEPAFCILCGKHRLRVAEIPGEEPRRIGGSSKVNKLSSAWAILILILKEFFNHRDFKEAPARAWPEKAGIRPGPDVESTVL